MPSGKCWSVTSNIDPGFGCKYRYPHDLEWWRKSFIVTIFIVEHFWKRVKSGFFEMNLNFLKGGAPNNSSCAQGTRLNTHRTPRRHNSSPTQGGTLNGLGWSPIGPHNDKFPPAKAGGNAKAPKARRIGNLTESGAFELGTYKLVD